MTTTDLSTLLAGTLDALRSPGCNVAGVLGVLADALEEAGDVRTQQVRMMPRAAWVLRENPAAVASVLRGGLTRVLTIPCSLCHAVGRFRDGADCHWCHRRGWEWKP